MRQRFLRIRLLIALGRKWAWRSLKHYVAILRGREPCFDRRGLFFWQVLLDFTKIRRMSSITCPGLPMEGAGSQALMIMSAIGFARVSGLTYVHTPFTSIAHVERPMQEWARAWETFFNLGAGELASGLQSHKAVDYCRHFNDLWLYFGWRGREDELFHRFRTLLPEFRRRYYLNKSPRRTEDLTVAVHVRRGDAHPDNSSYYTSNEAILRTMTLVKSVLDARGLNYSIGLYSEGDRADFEEVSLPGVELFLDADPLWTLEELVEADILIMAKGCFSRYASMLSDGVKIGVRESEWGCYLLPDNWVACLLDGSFDCTAFEHELSLVISSKTAVRTVE
jgi:hypothetical protein